MERIESHTTETLGLHQEALASRHRKIKLQCSGHRNVVGRVKLATGGSNDLQPARNVVETQALKVELSKTVKKPAIFSFYFKRKT